MAQSQSGYALIATAEPSNPIQLFAGLPGTISWPNGDRTQPGTVMAHADWQVVETWEDRPTLGINQVYSGPTLSFDGTKLWYTYAAADMTAAQIAAAQAAAVAALIGYNVQAMATKQAAGITVSGSKPIPCDNATASAINGLRTIAQDNTSTANWTMPIGPFPDGSFSAPMAPSTIISVAQAVGGFIASVANVAASNAAAISSGSMTTTGQIDTAFSAVKTSF